MSADDLVAGTLLIVGLGLYYVARRRVFNRRNGAKVETGV